MFRTTLLNLSKYLLMVSVLFSSLNCNAFVYEEHDKNLHFTVATASTSMAAYFLHKETKMSKMECYLAAMTIVMTAGILKESLVDKEFDKFDVRANFVGTLAAIPIVYFTF